MSPLGHACPNSNCSPAEGLRGKGHPGIVRMKALAHSHVWWPSIDRHLEEKVKACTPCQQQRHAAPLHPWAWPSFPWQQIHVDFAGPVAGKMLLVAVDAHSTWPEVISMPSTSAEKEALWKQTFLDDFLECVTPTVLTSNHYRYCSRRNSVL